MTRRRWIADEVSDNRAALIGDHADHLVRVLRARIGQEFDIATGSTVRRGRITSLVSDRVEFELGEEIPAESSIEIALILSIFKFDRMEWAIEKCTELGVSCILPVIASRTDSHLAAASVKRRDRWEKIAKQAAEQSRRAATPKIAAPAKLPDILDFASSMRIVLSENEENILVRDVLLNAAAPASASASSKDHEQSIHSIALAIGPEGGWTEKELQSFVRAGWISASLGNTILRAETAAIAATAIASAFR
jgi:16S rRNA (uracil1498-N3)-methyltransferase